MSATEDGEDSAVDPLSTAVLAKVAAGAGTETGKEAGRLISRVLGPAADQIGEALGRYTEFRLRNVGRIVDKASQKGPGRNEVGEVPPRVAHRLLDEGSYCDDELMAEYLGGVLAASRTPSGRDDRAIVWSDIVTGMSALQVRAHFLLYREWAVRLHGRTDLNLDAGAGRDASEMQVDPAEFFPLLLDDTGIALDQGLGHTIPGLVRLGLLGDRYAYGPRQEIGFPSSPFEIPLVVNISVAGIELYGWAQGRAGVTGLDFVSVADTMAEDDVPRLHDVALPKLPPTP